MLSKEAGRIAISVAALALVLAGHLRRDSLLYVHDSKNNWRGYRCLLSGGTCAAPFNGPGSSWISGFETLCNKKYGFFSPPEPDKADKLDFSGQFPEYPEADYLDRSPISALSSIVFTFVAIILCGMKVFPLAFALSLLSAGSFSLHSTGSGDGWVLDHVGCSFVALVAAFTCLVDACKTLERELPPWADIFWGVAFCITTSVFLSGIWPLSEISTVSGLVLAASVILSSVASQNIVFFFNVLVPLAVGVIINIGPNSPASKAEHRAECTGLLEDDEKYDIIHSLWHIAAAVGFLELGYGTSSHMPSVLSASVLSFFIPAFITTGTRGLFFTVIVALFIFSCVAYRYKEKKTEYYSINYKK